MIKSHQLRLDSFEADKKLMEKDLKSLKVSSIPIGFLYIEIPNQSSPKQLWPSLQWTEVTQQYAGLFFRAEGNGSGSFGQTQQDNAPHLRSVHFETYGDTTVKGDPSTINTNIGSWMDYITTGDVNIGVSHKLQYLSFLMSGGEVRPRNMAMRIWKRTG